MRIVIATSNVGKFEEFQSLLRLDGIHYQRISEFEANKIKETGSTYIENAIIKATTISKINNMPTIADDSGLEICTLNGYPGVRSTRCAGEFATDEEKRWHILEEMAGKRDRRARFICAMAFVHPDHLSTPTVFTGIAEGEILSQAVGDAGKGLQYDSIFYYPQFGTTFANVPKSLKNSVSHRGKAAAMMRKYLEGVLKGENSGFGNI